MIGVKVLEHKTSGVMRGVVNKDASLLDDLVSVTYQILDGAVRTVFAHKNGPFKKVEEIIEAAENGSLHDKPTEQPGEPVAAGGEAHEPPTGEGEPV